MGTNQTALNRKRKTNQARQSELGRNPCKSCGASEGTIDYTYVRKSGTEVRTTHCLQCMQSREEADMRRKEAEYR